VNVRKILFPLNDSTVRGQVINIQEVNLICENLGEYLILLDKF
jgi:hypothetical protein